MASILVYNHVAARHLEIRYAVDALLARIACKATWITSPDVLQAATSPRANLVLTYGIEPQALPTHLPSINVSSCGFFERLDKHQDENPVADPLDGLTIEPNAGRMIAPHRIVFEHDMVAATFFLLSRYEEVYAEELDSHGRFPASATRAARAGMLDRPLVDEYATHLRQAISCLLGDDVSLPSQSVWGGRSFAVALTHDVDMLRKYSQSRSLKRSIASLLVRYRDWNAAARTAGESLLVKLGWQADPYEYEVFCRAHKILEPLGCRSAYYFLVGGNTAFDRSPVALETPAARRVLDFLETEQYEIGFHPSYAAAVDEEQFRQQLQRLRAACQSPVVGGRHHYLHFTPPLTWQLWEKHDLSYDSTFGFEQLPGFRCGTCFPFQPFDLYERRVMDLWELPLTVMDQTLRDHSCCGLQPEAALQVMCNLLDRVKAVHGIFVLLWHPMFFDPISFPGWPEVFRQWLAYAAEQGAFIGSPRDILQLWNTSREQMRVIA